MLYYMQIHIVERIQKSTDKKLQCNFHLCFLCNQAATTSIEIATYSTASISSLSASFIPSLNDFLNPSQSNITSISKKSTKAATKVSNTFLRIFFFFIE